MCDLIRRQDAIDAHYEYCNKHPDAGFPVWSLKILEDLPPAQPETHEERTKTHSCDCISRKDAIDAVESMLRRKFGIGGDLAEITLAELPSAQPDMSEYSDKLWKKAYERGKAEALAQLEEAYISGETEAEARFHAQQRWIPCSERLPENTVLATIETKTFKHRYVCEAVWIPRWTWRADFDNWEDCSEYNEDEDEFYVLEGWYERVHNWDEYSYVGIEDNVIAWMPLPEPYREGK